MRARTRQTLDVILSLGAFAAILFAAWYAAASY